MRIRQYIAVAHGTAKISTSLISWVISLSVGVVANFVYAVILLIKNRTCLDHQQCLGT